jgi:hypothetical protein
MTPVEEVHNSVLWAAALAIPGLAMLAFAVTHAIPALRVGLGFGGTVMLAAAAMAWTGFHYVFTPSGVEIRAFGHLLRNIPAAEIRDYHPDHWNVAGGYGIRGLGASRAYVWGNRGVRIKTSDGQVFLGCNDPQKLIRDLDQITNRNH